MLGDIAAATLGYIINNSEGAYRGHSMYRRYRSRSLSKTPGRKTPSPRRKLNYGARNRSVSRGRTTSRGPVPMSISRSRSVSRRGYTRTSVDNAHSGVVTHRRVRLGRGLAKRPPKNSLATMQYQQQNTLAITCDTGTQTMYSIALDLTVDQLVSSTTTTGPAPNIYARGLFHYNPELRAAGDYGTLITPEGTRRGGSKMYVKYISYEFMISNESTTPATLELYWVKPTGGGTNLQWGGTNTPLTEGCLGPLTSIIDQEMLGVGNAVQNTLASGVTGIPLQGKPTLTTFGFNPFSIKGFGKAFKLVKKKIVELAASANEKISISIPIGKYYDESYVTNISQNSNGCIPYHTMQLFGILKGSPVIVKTGSAVDYSLTDGACTTSQVEVAIAFVRKISVAYVKGGASSVHVVSNNFRTLSGTTVPIQINVQDAETQTDIAN